MANRICPCGYVVAKGEKCDCAARRATERQRKADAARPSASARGYDGAWAKIRAEHLALQPDCVECGRPGSHVDHVQSVREAQHRRLDSSNLRTMCHSCHSRRTARDQSKGWGAKA